MKGHKTAFAALMLGAALASPAKAEGDIGISFGYDDGLTAVAPCDYYRYYEAPPPWGLPDDYCSDLLSYEPVYYDGFWYRGPVYHRHHHGKDEVWLHGGWREDNSQGRSRPATITWQDRGGPLHGFRADFHPGHGAHGSGGETHVDVGNEGPNAHSGGNVGVHSDAPVAHGGDASSAHVSAPSSGGESHGGGSSGGGGGHESGSGGGGSHH
jgi:hypothetical protein